MRIHMNSSHRIIRAVVLAGTMALFFACSTPANIAYIQDVREGTVLTPPSASAIRLKPMDQISIIVSCRDPQVAAMFNLPTYTRRIGEQSNLSANLGSNSNGMSGYTVSSKGVIDFRSSVKSSSPGSPASRRPTSSRNAWWTASRSRTRWSPWSS